MAVACIVLMVLSVAAHAERRVALVIGNSTYKHAGELANPRNDANDMASALQAVDFDVIKGLDLDKRSLEQEVRKFSVALSGADVGVFFYAGHGLQVNGNNYLVPVDAELSTADALEFEMIRLDVVQRIMEGNAKTNILFLDACRNNPLARNLARALGTRSAAIGRGLAPAESGVGTLISFSTQPGNVASDGAGRNSPFTGPLVKRIVRRGVDILTVLTDVRNDVLAVTNEKQVPWENHALRARFYFNGGPSSPEAPGVGPDRSELERAWEFIKETEDQSRLEEFIKRFGDTPYAPMARTRLEELKKRRIATPEPKHSEDTGTQRFDGTWQMVRRGRNCAPGGENFIGQLIIRDGVVSSSIGAGGFKGSVSASGSLQLSHLAKGAPGTTLRYVGSLRGNEGSGHFENTGTSCRGTFTLTRG